MILYLIRGLPGSGKSTFARQLGCLHVEADMFHVRNKQYCFNKDQSLKGHHWCQWMVRTAIEMGMDVAVANTFSRKWELVPYLMMAERAGYEVRIISMSGAFGSIHMVPEETVERMKERWEAIQGEEEIVSDPITSM